MPIMLAEAASPPAVAAPAPARVSVLTQPDWLSKPTVEDFAELYPKDAVRDGVEGSATIACKVDASGSLVDCLTASETPAGAGFGAAALAMAGKFRMRPMMKDGAPVAGGTVRIPIRFVLPKDTLPQIAVALRCYGYAAAEAERNPASPSAQAGVFAFGLVIQARLLPEHPRPSEVAQVLASQRGIAAGKLDDPNLKAERDECATALPANATANLQRLVVGPPR